MNIPCCYCGETKNGFLTVLSSDSPEFHLSLLTRDGTKKWYKCNSCKGVFCKDKLTGQWQLSPATYSTFVEKGYIKDQLLDD